MLALMILAGSASGVGALTGGVPITSVGGGDCITLFVILTVTVTVVRVSVTTVFVNCTSTSRDDCCVIATGVPTSSTATFAAWGAVGLKVSPACDLGGQMPKAPDARSIVAKTTTSTPAPINNVLSL